MKNTILSITALLLLSAPSLGQGMNGNDLSKALIKSLEEASVEIDVNSIVAWESSVSADEVEVKILSNDHVHLSYGCHYHGQTMACHEEHLDAGHNHKSILSGFSYIQAAHQAAVEKLTKTLVRKGVDFSVVNNLKVWSQDDDHDHEHIKSDDHGEGADVWSKFNYSLNEKSETVFVLCHTHGNESDFSCHYSRTGEDEPNL